MAHFPTPWDRSTKRPRPPHWPQERLSAGYTALPILWWQGFFVLGSEGEKNTYLAKIYSNQITAGNFPLRFSKGQDIQKCDGLVQICLFTRSYSMWYLRHGRVGANLTWFWVLERYECNWYCSPSHHLVLGSWTQNLQALVEDLKGSTIWI